MNKGLGAYFCVSNPEADFERGSGTHIVKSDFVSGVSEKDVLLDCRESRRRRRLDREPT